jgi:hypothetical protein
MRKGKDYMCAHCPLAFYTPAFAISKLQRTQFFDQDANTRFLGQGGNSMAIDIRQPWMILEPPNNMYRFRRTCSSDAAGEEEFEVSVAGDPVRALTAR